MKLRMLILSVGIAGLLGPATILAADTEPTKPAPTDQASAKPKTKTYVGCDRVTGTAIRPSTKNDCKSSVQPYRVYTQDELQRTGESNIADALRKLDPIFH
ncbi:MAG: hypothetical protein ABI616_01020 [Pseudomonadota bacterium]